jgi:hypothetical protein
LLYLETFIPLLLIKSKEKDWFAIVAGTKTEQVMRASQQNQFKIDKPLLEITICAR